MFNLEKFIADSVTSRPVSMFAADIEANRKTLIAEIKNKKVCVIGGAGSIGSSFIKAVLRFEPKSVVIVDLNENGLAELVRDVRSTEGLYVPEEFRCYTLNFADSIFERIITFWCHTKDLFKSGNSLFVTGCDVPVINHPVMFGFQ